MNFIKFLQPVIATSLIFSLSGCRGRVPIEEHHTRPMPDNAHYLTEEQIRRTIIKTAENRKWACSHNAPNTLKCQLHTRGHEAVINIRYTHTDYSITHCSSKNLLETKTKIHPKFKKWVQKLDQDIFQAIRKK